MWSNSRLRLDCRGSSESDGRGHNDSDILLLGVDWLADREAARHHAQQSLKRVPRSLNSDTAHGLPATASAILAPQVPRSQEERHRCLETINYASRLCVSREEDATGIDSKTSLGCGLAIGDPDA